jgi:putative DNA-invertase from lambdoid prophage Rac
MMLGYARVSTADQTTDLQLDALARAGVDRLWQDTCSGTIAPEDRAEFARLLDVCREGDEVVVWALDRLGRSAGATLRVIDLLAERGVTIRVLKEGLVTSGPTGKLVVTILAAVAELERSFILERSREGMDAARARDVHMGRPSSLTAAQKAHARELRGQDKSYAEIARILGTSKATVHRACTP